MRSKKRMFTLLIAGIILIAAACAGAYVLFFRMANPPLKNGEVKIGSSVFEVEIASSTLEQARGLSFRTSLGEQNGMLFVFGSPGILNFWMKDMNFPLDMIWIGGGKVVGFAQDAVPQPGVPLWGLTIYNSPDGTDEVLEVNAGTVVKDNIKIGDAVQVGPVD